MKFVMTGSLMRLMVDLAMAYKALSRYELCQCLELFSSLPPHQMNTPWVFTQLARAHFEQGNYNEVLTAVLESIVAIVHFSSELNSWLVILQ